MQLKLENGGLRLYVTYAKHYFKMKMDHSILPSTRTLKLKDALLKGRPIVIPYYLIPMLRSLPMPPFNLPLCVY
jgi:hypothetical protein